jgi:hypothetical protein
MTTMTVSTRASKNCLKMPTRFRSSSAKQVVYGVDSAIEECSQAFGIFFD